MKYNGNILVEKYVTC